jgi:hypothetical protein
MKNICLVLIIRAINSIIVTIVDSGIDRKFLDIISDRKDKYSIISLCDLDICIASKTAVANVSYRIRHINKQTLISKDPEKNIINLTDGK